MAINNDDLLAAIDAGAESSYGTDESSALGRRRAESMEAYLGLNTNPAPDGRSQVVDRSVYETIQTILPSLVRIFASSSDEICKCVPTGPEDEEAAEQTTAVLNWCVREQNQWEQICQDWMLDSMLMCNGYVAAYWDENDALVRETYTGQSDDQVAAIVSDEEVTVVQHSEYQDDAATAELQAQYEGAMQQHQQMVQAAAMQGQPPPPPPPPPAPVMLHDLVIDRREAAGGVCIRVLPPEHTKVSIDTPDWTLKDCPFFEFRRQMTISELRSMGLDVPDDISDNEDSDDTDEDDARDRFGEDRISGEDDRGGARKVWTRMTWVKADAEGDGVVRQYYCIVVGRQILFSEPVARITVASMTPQPLPHRHIGLSIAETIEDIQDIKTAITRGAVDNLMLANNGRHVVSRFVNLQDFMESRPGGLVRMLGDHMPAEGHVMPLSHPYAFDSIVGSLAYFDEVRQNRTGANKYFSGTDAGAINKTAAGASLLTNMASMRVEHLARVMAPAVEYLFTVVQELWAKHRNKPVTLKIRGGKWVTVDPQAWRTKRDIRISVGVGAGNRESMMQQLGMIFAAQMQTLPIGLANPPTIHATLTEMAKAAGFPNPDKFWVDPTRTAPPPPPPTPEQIAAQTALQIKQMELQAEAQKFQAETALRLKEIEAQAQAKMQELTATLQVQATNDARDGERELQKAQIEASLKAQLAAQQEEFQRWQAELEAQTKLVVAQIQAEGQAQRSMNQQPRKK